MKNAAPYDCRRYRQQWARYCRGTPPHVPLTREIVFTGETGLAFPRRPASAPATVAPPQRSEPGLERAWAAWLSRSAAPRARRTWGAEAPARCPDVAWPQRARRAPRYRYIAARPSWPPRRPFFEVN